MTTSTKTQKGLLGTKLGMTQVWDENNRLVPVTVIQAGPNVVTQVRDAETDGYAAVQLGYGAIDPRKVTKPLTGHTLGAAGATEAALCWLLLSDLNTKKILPAQCNQKPPDASLPPIAIVRSTQALPHTKNLSMLSNSFAFGGSNAAVILSRQA